VTESELRDFVNGLIGKRMVAATPEGGALFVFTVDGNPTERRETKMRFGSLQKAFLVSALSVAGPCASAPPTLA
jgi:hypothetical protein